MGEEGDGEHKSHNFDEKGFDELEFDAYEYTSISDQINHQQIDKIKSQISHERRDWPDPTPAALKHHIMTAY